MIFLFHSAFFSRRRQGESEGSFSGDSNFIVPFQKNLVKSFTGEISDSESVVYR